jgi:hypothetical protein
VLRNFLVCAFKQGPPVLFTKVAELESLLEEEPCSDRVTFLSNSFIFALLSISLFRLFLMSSRDL